MTTKASMDSYVRLSQIIIGLIALFFILFIAQGIILPLIFSLLIAILLNPVVNFLHSKGLNRIVAIALSLLLALSILGALIYFLASQVSMFTDALPQLKQKITELQSQSLQWVSQTFNVSPRKVNNWVTKTTSEGMNNSMIIGTTFNTLTGISLIIVLLPVYTFFILFYKPLLQEFILKVFSSQSESSVTEVLTQTKTLIQSYLVGLLVEAAIVAILDSAVLLIIGVEYAILFGVLAALLNIIPYVGGVVAISLPIIMALANHPPITAVYILLGFLAVQFIDNNFIVPRIVASRVKINALLAIIVVIIGDALWGVAGMFLALPLTAILKVIFDRVDLLKPWGFLLGDTMPNDPKKKLRMRILKPKK